MHLASDLTVDTVHLGILLMQISDSAGLGWAPGFFMSHELPGERGAAGPWGPLSEAKAWRTQQRSINGLSGWGGPGRLGGSLPGRWQLITDCLVFRCRSLGWGSDVCISDKLHRGLWMHHQVWELADLVQLPRCGVNHRLNNSP